MSKGWLIPDDWDGVSWNTYLLCVPDSILWAGNVRGAVYDLSRVYNWDASTGDADVASQTGMEVFNSMSNCNDIVTALNGIKNALVAQSCSCTVGQGIDNGNGQEGGGTPGNIGDITYSQPVAINDRKCKASNYIFDTLKNIMVEFDNNHVPELGILGLGSVLSIVTSLIAIAVAGPLAAVVVVVAGVIASATASMIGVSVDLPLLISVMNANQEELVCDLYEAQSSDVARDNFLATLDSNGAGFLNVNLIGLIMTNAVMNILFFDVDGLSDFLTTYVSTVDCSGCSQPAGCWYFDTGEDGWTHVDVSTANASSSMVYDAGNQALRVDQHTDAVSQQIARGHVISPSLQPLAVGVNQYQVRAVVNGPNDALGIGMPAIIEYDDTSTQQVILQQGTVPAGAVDFTCNWFIATAGNVVGVTLVPERGNGGVAVSWDYFILIKEVCIELIP